MLNFSYLNDIPETGVKLIFFLLFLIAAILIYMIPKEYITSGVEKPKWYHNLKFWAVGVLSILSFLHIIF